MFTGAFFLLFIIILGHTYKLLLSICMICEIDYFRKMSILFIHYRILNKHVPLNILMRYIHMRINTTKLLQYTKFVETFIKKK